MATANKISAREQIQNELVSYLENRGNLNAPYGILYGVRKNFRGKGSHREITFGKARTLDATILIYAEDYFVFRWQGSLLSRGHGTNTESFKSKDELIAFLDEAL